MAYGKEEWRMGILCGGNYQLQHVDEQGNKWSGSGDRDGNNGVMLGVC